MTHAIPTSKKFVLVGALLSLLFGMTVLHAPRANALGSECQVTDNGKECASPAGFDLEAITTNNGTMTFNGHENFVQYPTKADCDTPNGSGSSVYSSPDFNPGIAPGDTKAAPDPSGPASGYYRVKFIRANGNKYPSQCFFWNDSTSTITDA